MPNIVNQSFFVADLLIPNLNNTPNSDRLTMFINKFESDCLLKILGYPLFKLFGSEASTRMTELLNGSEYTDGEGNLRKWQGIKHDTSVSLIANYVYFYFLQDQAAQLSGVGTSVAKPESAAAISPAQKMSNAWNFFSTEVNDMAIFLWLKKDGAGERVYPEFNYHQFCETRRISRKIDSVFQF